MAQCLIKYTSNYHNSPVADISVTLTRGQVYLSNNAPCRESIIGRRAELHIFPVSVPMATSVSGHCAYRTRHRHIFG